MLLYLKNLLDSFQTLRRLSQDNDCREHQRHPGSVDSHGAVAVPEAPGSAPQRLFIWHPCSQTANREQSTQGWCAGHLAVALGSPCAGCLGRLQPLLSAPELLWKRHLSLPLLTTLAGLSLGQALKVGVRVGGSKVMKIGSHSPQRAESGAIRQKNQGPDVGQGQQYLAMVELQTDCWGPLATHMCK